MKYFPKNVSYNQMDIISLVRSFLLVSAMFFCLQGSSQSVKYSNEYLKIGVGARSLGMGQAMASHTNDVYAAFWNPAGLLSITNDLEVALMHSEYFAGIAKYDYAGFAKPLAPTETGRKHSIGISALRLGVDDIPNTILLFEPDGSINYNNIRNFSVADYGFFFSYATTLPQIPNLRTGASLKVIYRQAGSFAKAWGFGFDLGAQYDWKNFQFGAQIRDLTTTFNAWYYNFSQEEKDILILTNNAVPVATYETTLPSIDLGASHKAQLSEKISMLAALDLNLTTDGKRNVLLSAKPFSIDPKLGMEFGYSDFLFLRLGLGNVQRATVIGNSTENKLIAQPNAGIGLRMKNILLDYAFTDFADVNNGLYSHVFSLKLGIKRDDVQR